MAVCYGEGGFMAFGGEAKYDSMSGDSCSKEVEGPFGVGVWKHY